MRSFQLLLPLLALHSFAFAQTTDLASSFGEFPACASSCFMASVAKSPCELTNATCICTNVELQGSVQGCVYKSCTLRESLNAKNISATACHAPVRNEGESTRVNNIALSIMAAILVMVRITYQAFFSIAGFGWDDYSILAAYIVGVPAVIITDRGVLPTGLGRDVWTVPFDHITSFVRWMYILEIIYLVQIPLLKLSLLMFFLRIFTKPSTRRLLWITVAFNSLMGFCYIISAIFQCQPISSFWTLWDNPARASRCLNFNALGWSHSAMSITLDIWMLSLPLYEVSHLQMAWRKKCSVAFMFFVGTFVTVVSILRLRTLIDFASTTNPTMVQWDLVHWSSLETNIGIACACLPALRIILSRVFSKYVGSSRGTNHSTGHGPQSSRGMRASDIPNTLRGSTKSKLGSDTILYTQTFELQHADNDEISLVHEDRLSLEGLHGQSNSAHVTAL